MRAAWLIVVTRPAFAQDADDGSSLEFSAAYTGDLRRNTTGGVAVGTAYADALDLGLGWSTDRLFPGATFTGSLAVMHLGGDEISRELVGDLQGVNSIEAPAGWRLYESWVQLGFGEATSVRAGILDLNAEFDTPVTQALFTASPFAIGTDLSQTGVRGPVVWPTTGLGLRVAGNAGQSLQWRFGVYDGAPGTDDDDFTSVHVSSDEGALLIGELEYSSQRIHKAALGAWAYTARFERIDAALRPPAEPEKGNHGVYATIDVALGSIGPMEFDAALRVGTAPDEFNAVDRYCGAALTATHLWPTRPDDSLGLGIAWAHAGAPYRAVSDVDGAPATSAETLVELAYRADLTDWLALVPNVQFVADPGALRDPGDSWVLGLRVELAHERAWPTVGAYAHREH
jgi:porin